MTGRFLGWSRAVTQAAFAYSGLEVVAVSRDALPWIF